MHFGLEAFFGAGAVILSCGAFIPQIIKSFKTKSVNDISWLMILAAGCANIFWISYGIMRLDPVIIITDSFVFMTLIFLGIIKYKHDK